MMAVFFFIRIAHEKGFKFHVQPQTCAYSCYNPERHLNLIASICIINTMNNDVLVMTVLTKFLLLLTARIYVNCDFNFYFRESYSLTI